MVRQQCTCSRMSSRCYDSWEHVQRCYEKEAVNKQAAKLGLPKTDAKPQNDTDAPLSVCTDGAPLSIQVKDLYQAHYPANWAPLVCDMQKSNEGQSVQPGTPNKPSGETNDTESIDEDAQDPHNGDYGDQKAG